MASSETAKSEPVTPVPAATLLLLRDSAQGVEVLMMERHRDQFFSSALVFPGGRVEPEDGTGEASFRVAAIRETWEEAGLLLAKKRGETALVTAIDLPRETTFAALLANGSFEIATDALVPFAHWVTPEPSPQRYDTLFYLARAPESQTPRADGQEAVELLWITPAQAMADADAKRRRLIFATRLNLMRLAKYPTVEAALSATHLVAPICPVMYQTAEGPRIRIPEGLGYDICDLPTPDHRHG